MPLRLLVEYSFVAIRRGAGQVRNYLLAHGLSEKEIWACELAFVEACNNAVQHAPPAQSENRIVVEISCGSSQVELRINDYSEGFDFPSQPVLPAPDEESGRGIYLMRALMDEVDYVRESSSNCLVLKKARTGI